MPYADPDRAAAYVAAWWARNGRAYRASRGAEPKPPPIGRSQVLAEDLAQERELARLEARHGLGWRRATRRLEAYARRERGWIAVTSTRFTIDGREPDDAD